MSLRPTTFQPPDSPSVGNTSKRLVDIPDSPGTPDSPTRAVNDRHRAQLSSYRQGPAPSGSASLRLSALTSSWTYVKNLGGLIDTPTTEPARPSTPPPGVRNDHKSRSPAVSRSRLSLRLPRRRRMFMVFVGFALLYFFVARPLLSISASRQLPTTSTKFLSVLNNIGDMARSGSKRAPKPLHSRKAAEGSRASLPPQILSRSIPDHEIHNGLLRVNPASKMHPIYQLIRDAREAWDEKLDRQSTTLKEAVDEYKRRYGRPPPKGFDKWWEWICDNDVQMPDEYDQIDTDLRPFRALSPRDLNARIEAASQSRDTYTIRVSHGSIRTSSTFNGKEISGADERLEGQLKLLRPVAKHIGDFSAVYTVHDTPSVLISHGHRHELLDHVIDGEYIDPDWELDLSRRGWTAMCPQSAPIHSYDRFAPRSVTGLAAKTFIASHDHLMNICAHPDLVPIHGFLSGKNPAVGPLMPIFCLSKTSLHADVLGVPTEQWMTNLPNKPWEDRTENRVMWRGSNTGGYFSEATTWRNSHRLRLNRQATTKDGNATVLPAPKTMKRGDSLQRLANDVTLAEANKFYLDIAFTGKPIQCDVADGTCDALANEYVFGPQMTHDAAFNYKYVVDVDGNAWSARFQRLLTSGSLVFKSTIMPEWWQDRIQPWVHYIPLQVDYSDLYDLVTFFRGNLTGEGGESNLAREIAKAGREWSMTYWRQVDMTAYVFRLYLEWARLVASDRKSMDFVYDPAMERTRPGKGKPGAPGAEATGAGQKVMAAR